MSYLVIVNGKIMSPFDTLQEAEKYAGGLSTGEYDTIVIAEAVVVYKRKVTYDKVSRNRTGVDKTP